MLTGFLLLFPQEERSRKMESLKLPRLMSYFFAWQYSRKNIKSIVCTIILLHGCIVFAHPLVNVPPGDELYHEVYDFIDRLVAQKSVDGVFKNTLPYSREEVAQILIELDGKVKQGSLKLSRVEEQKLKQFLAVFSEDLHALGYPTTSPVKSTHLLSSIGEKHQIGFDFGLGEYVISRSKESMKRQTGYATLFRPTVAGQIRDDFAFYSDFKVYYLSAVQFPDIPKTEGRRIKQLHKESATGALSSYYFKFKLPWFELFYGKDNVHWGPGRHGALMLSENPDPINMLRLTALYPPVKFQAFTGILQSELAKKYVTSHRLEYHPFKRLRFGISESIIYSERFETIYLNPLQIYLITQTSNKYFKGEAQENPDNVLISGDWDIILLKNLELYGELLIDEFRPFSFGMKTFKDWGSKFGVLFGGYYVDPLGLGDTDLRVEYAFINQYTYTHHRLANAYTNFDSIIGHKIGTDADDLWLNLKHWFTANLTMSLGYELERHGEGDVNKPHEESGASENDEWEFLSGITESTNSLSLGVSYRSTASYFLHAEYTHSWIKNVEHKLGGDSSKQQILLEAEYRF